MNPRRIGIKTHLVAGPQSQLAGRADGDAADIALDQALSRFMARRFERCRMVVDNSARLGELEMRLAPPQEQAELARASMMALSEPI